MVEPHEVVRGGGGRGDTVGLRCGEHGDGYGDDGFSTDSHSHGEATSA